MARTTQHLLRLERGDDRPACEWKVWPEEAAHRAGFLAAAHFTEPEVAYGEWTVRGEELWKDSSASWRYVTMEFDHFSEEELVAHCLALMTHDQLVVVDSLTSQLESSRCSSGNGGLETYARHLHGRLIGAPASCLQPCIELLTEEQLEELLLLGAGK